MNIRTFPLGPVQTNAYLLTNKETKEAILIDAPEGIFDIVQRIINEEGIKLIAVLITHGHWDHTYDLYKFKGTPIYAHNCEANWIEDPSIMTTFLMPGLKLYPVKVDHWLKHGQKLELCGEEIEIRHTPGHAPDNVLFYIPTMHAAFVGDTIFEGSIGRYDLPLSNYNALEKSIRNQIYTLPNNTVLHTGHGNSTSVLNERESNPFVRDL